MPIRLGGNTGEFSRIGFRGDDRVPTSIFATGFQSQHPEQAVTPRAYQSEITGMARPALFDLMPGDIDPESAVTFSARVTAAAMFPLRVDEGQPTVSDTYVYAVVVDTGLYNTFQKQVLHGLDSLRNWEAMTGREVDEQAGRMVFWPAYAQEMATKRIPNTHIVGALRVTRTWKGNNYKWGAKFVFHGPPILNVNCAIDRGTKNIVCDVLTDYANDGVGNSPEVESGYHASTSR